MKSLFAFGIALAFGLAMRADQFRLEGEPFRATAPIVWTASMSNVPPSVTVYRVLPQKFSDETVSNILAISGFTWKTMTESQDKKTMSWRHYENGRARLVRSLDLAPVYGYVSYYDYSAVSFSPEGVPSREQAEKFAMDYLRRLGGDTNQLWIHPHSATERRDMTLDKVSKRFVTNVVMRGGMYARQFEGIRFLGAGGRGGFGIDFAAKGKIASLQLDWRNAERYRTYNTVSADQIAERVKSGQAVVAVENPDIPKDIKKLMITRITPYYMCATGGSPADFIFPFANLEITAATTGTNTSIFYLNCSILP